MTATGYELLRALSPNADRVSIHEPLLRREKQSRKPVKSTA